MKLFIFISLLINKKFQTRNNLRFLVGVYKTFFKKPLTKGYGAKNHSFVTTQKNKR